MSVAKQRHISYFSAQQRGESGMLQMVAERPELIVAAAIAGEILRGNGRLMGEQLKEGMMTDPLGKIMLAIVTALVLWVGQNTQGNSLKLAALEQKVDSFTADRFTGAQAALLDQRLRRVEIALDRMAE